MSPRSIRLLACALVAILAVVGVTSASAAKRKPAKIPSIQSLAPKKLGVGDTLTIRGKNFVPGKKRNTVVFKRDGKRAIFVKADTATSTRIKVKIPKKLAAHFSAPKGQARSTRFRVRVLARRFGKRFTSLKASPSIGPANVDAPDAIVAPVNIPPAAPPPSPPDPDCDGDGTTNSADGDDDNDMLTDALEAQIGTNPCLVDSDRDGMEDAWEYESALDLNIRALPYPGKRPYPNPLDGSDLENDYDGDNLENSQEHALWQFVGPRSRILSYSGGQKYTGGTESVPASSDPALAHQDFDGDGHLSDNERDADGDRFSNWDEYNGRMTPKVWANPNEYHGLDPLDPDSDGDGVRDDRDDIDHDDFDNFYELSKVLTPGVNPFDPCAPNLDSRTCSEPRPQ